MATSIQDLKMGISIKLNELFGDTYKIYAEEVKQGLSPPSFFIKHVRSSASKGIGGRYTRNNLFSVNFFPVENGAELEQCDAVADTLLIDFEYVMSGADTFRTTKKNSFVLDKVLHFEFEINYPILKVEAEELMANLTQTSTTTEE